MERAGVNDSDKKLYSIIEAPLRREIALVFIIMIHGTWKTNNGTGHKVARCVVLNISTDNVAIEFEVIRMQTIIEAAMIMNDT